MLCFALSGERTLPHGGNSASLTPPSVLYRYRPTKQPLDSSATTNTPRRYTRNLNAREVAALMLLERSTCTRPVLHLPPAQQLDALEPRVAMALRHSVAVVSAFAPLPTSAEQRLVEGRGTPAVARGAPRRLVGVAHAYGDASLVATMADVVVCSTLAGSAVAGMLVKLLCERVCGVVVCCRKRALPALHTLYALRHATQVWRNGNVSDLGTLATPAMQPLLAACDWGPDPEGSTAMALDTLSRGAVEALLEGAYSPQQIAARHVDSQAVVATCLRQQYS